MSNFTPIAHLGQRSFVLADPAVPDIWAQPGVFYDGNRNTKLGLSVRTITTAQLRALVRPGVELRLVFNSPQLASQL